MSNLKHNSGQVTYDYLLHGRDLTLQTLGRVQAALSQAVQLSESEKGCFIPCGNKSVHSFLR